MEKPNQNTALVLIVFSVVLNITSRVATATVLTRILGIGILVYAIALFWEAKGDTLAGNDWIADSLKAVSAFILGFLVLSRGNYTPAVMGILFAAIGLFGILEYFQNASRQVVPYLLHGITALIGLFLFFYPFSSMGFLMQCISAAFLYIGVTGLLSEY